LALKGAGYAICRVWRKLLMGMSNGAHAKPQKLLPVLAYAD